MAWWLRVLVWTPLAFFLVLETILSSLSSLPHIPGMGFAHADKVVHTTYFFLSGLSGVQALHFWEGWSRKKAGLMIVLVVAIYGVADEFHQSFVPHRSPEALDLLADVTGATMAAWLGPILLNAVGYGKFVSKVLQGKGANGKRRGEMPAGGVETPVS